MRFASLFGMRAAWIPLFSALGLVACGPQYAYRPVVTTTAATVSGLPASYYPIPPESPRGHVRVATIGLAELKPEGARADDDDDEVKAIHVRVVVANNSERQWLVDTRQQHAILPSGGVSRPAYASAQGDAPPQVVIPPRGERSIDLYYPLPSSMQKESKLPAFDVLWQVDTGERVVVERTPFERITIEAPVDTYADSYAFSSPYWYDPYYRYGGGFYGSVGVGFGPVFVQRPVIIRPYHSAPPGRRVR